VALADQMRALCGRLSPSGWGPLLQRHGLDLDAPDLVAELLRPLPSIDRSLPGFEDFAAEGHRGIQPGSPCRSLLLHALASPAVLQDAHGTPLRDFPTPAELEAVENAVFGLVPPTLAELQRRAGGAFLALAVFASEYRPAGATVHRRHADLCFSRTGVARVGTEPARYDPVARGFVTEVDDDPHAVRVLPARYAAYLAMQLPGFDGRFGPMNAELRAQHPDLFGSDRADGQRRFWVPLHKVFSGPECIRGLHIRLTLRTHHVNEKLRRIHLQLARQGHPSGRTAQELTRPPFVVDDGIADWSSEEAWGPGMLVPVPSDRLVEPAEHRGSPVSFPVPPDPSNGFAPSLFLAPERGFRRAPEYVHVRTLVDPELGVRDLNDDPEVAELVRRGGYDALHHIDHSGDGWVVAEAPQLAVDVPRSVPAYSLVTAPDFHPYCDQRELMEWWVQRAPSAIRRLVWSTPPLTLADERLAPNLQLTDVDFRAEDDTVTAIVALPERRREPRPINPGRPRRHTHLPDGAAGVFAPGWDTSRDETGGTPHLAGYGLGSPFAEDAKLCAALSAFWPAAAPDAARSFSRTLRSVCPLTDEELGLVGDDVDPLPWDGVPGPSRRRRDGVEVVDYASFDHVDYVEQALAGRFTTRLTCAITTDEYVHRVLSTARVYLATGLRDAARNWPIVSFRRIDEAAPEVGQAQAAAGIALAGDLYRYELIERGRELALADGHRRVEIEVVNRVIALVGALPVVLVHPGTGDWQAVPTP
jgi:hypothetical protein